LEENKMRGLFGIGLLALSTICAAGQESWEGDGESLLRKCSVQLRVLDGEKVPSAEVVDAATCVGYLWGVHDMEFTVQMLEAQQKVKVMRHSCVPPNATTSQMVRVVVKYLRDNPDRLNLPSAILATDAIRSAFPCTSPKDER
jgi:hypothetical protein